MREQEEKFAVRSAANVAIRSAMRVGVVLATTISLGSGPSAQESGGAAPSIGPSTGPSAGPKGLPTPNYPSSPHRGVIDGWTGKPIPCRCRFEGKQLYPRGVHVTKQGKLYVASRSCVSIFQLD